MIVNIPGPIPSKKNSLQRIARGNRVFTVSSDAHQRWHRAAFWTLKGHKPVTGFKGIEIRFWFKTNQASDLTNKAESVMDLLVDAKIIEDDCWQITGPVTLVPMGIDRVNPRAEVQFTFKEGHDVG